MGVSFLFDNRIKSEIKPNVRTMKDRHSDWLNLPYVLLLLLMGPNRGSSVKLILKDFLLFSSPYPTNFCFFLIKSSSGFPLVFETYIILIRE